MKICDIFFKKERTLFVIKIKLMRECGMSSEEACKCLYACCPTKSSYVYAQRMGLPEENIYKPDDLLEKKYKFNKDNYIKWLNNLNMKFDTIIQNPPYNGSLHLDFLEKGIDLLTDEGKMVIIEPATWLINIRKNGKGKRYDTIKKKLGKHIQSVVIENLNKEFNITMYMPFATTTIDMSKEYNKIDCTICGEHKEDVNSIYDCNLIGNYELIWSILNKMLKYGDMMCNHLADKELKENEWCIQYAELISASKVGCCGYHSPTSNFNNPNLWQKTPFGIFPSGYFINGCCSEIDFSKEAKFNSTYGSIYGTKEELNNWKHFVYNNKLSLFINIVMTIDQHNNSKPFLPWLVDKQYTDDEINKMFEFTEEEINLINNTIEKYSKNSEWLIRYMRGTQSK